MKSPRLIVTRKLPQSVEDRLARKYDAILNVDDFILPPDEIILIAEGADALLITPTEPFSRQMISRLPASVRILATFSVGYDHIDLAAAGEMKLAVTNTPDVLTDATADIAMLLLLGAARGASWGMKMIREDNWPAWSPSGPLGHDVTGKRLGILGMGRIGRALAHRATSFGMEIHYFNRNRLPEELERGAQYHETMESLLSISQFLSINCALTPETKGLLNAAMIARLPKGAIVINTARGDIVDDGALINALSTGHLAGAGLDVFTGEPAIDPRYRQLDNVFALPHLGSATPDTREAMGMRAADNLDAFFAGKTPRDLLTMR